MCIICNLRDPASDMPTAVALLGHYRDAQIAMKNAAAALLDVSRLDMAPETQRHYASVHKQMRRVMREWNEIEHKREPKASA